jgi:hypothetical protein
MAYSALTDAETNAGEPGTQSLFKKIKDDLIDHESRILTAEGANAQLFPIEFAVEGEINDSAAVDGLLHYRVSAALTVLAIRALVITAGSSGTLSVDVEYKRGAGSWTSLLTGAITIAFGTGDLATAAGTLSVTDLLAGDFLRLNVNSIQTGMQDFVVYVENKGA